MSANHVESSHRKLWLDPSMIMKSHNESLRLDQHMMVSRATGALYPRTSQCWSHTRAAVNTRTAQLHGFFVLYRLSFLQQTR